MGGIHDIDAYGVHLKAAAKSPRTVSLRVWQLRRLAEHRPGSLRTVTTAELADYLTGQGWSPATMYSVRATLRDFYRWAHATGRVRRDPTAGLPPIRVQRREPVPAPDEVLGAARGDDRSLLMVDLAGRQGLRRAEIAAIHSRDLRREVDGWLLVVHGKGGKERTVPLLPEVARRLRMLGPGWAFPSPRGGHLTPCRVGVLISAALPDGWTPHSLRRRFATAMYRGGHDLKAVQRHLGHASIATTEAYIGQDRERLRDALRWVC